MRALVPVPLLLLLAHCQPSCPGGSQVAEVHQGRGYVCVPTADDEEAVSAAPVPTPASPSCATVAADGNDVVLASSFEAPPTFASAALVDGTYRLARATSYSAAYVRPPFGLRASLVKTGPTFVLGAQPTGASSGGNESITLVRAEDLLVETCATRRGKIADTLFPGAIGAVEHAELAVDDAGYSLLVLHLSNETIVLAFVRV